MTTIADRISRQLEEEIISGMISPGQKLEEQLLAEKFGVSRSPIRDALRQLGGTGLVTIKPNRSVTVVDLQVGQINDIYEVLGEYEAAQRGMARARRACRCNSGLGPGTST